jgi:hypothetical protein
VSLALLLAFAGFMAWAAFSHPQMTRTELALTYWPAFVLLALGLLAAHIVERFLGRRPR